jgi:hypothetical protein
MEILINWFQKLVPVQYTGILPVVVPVYYTAADYNGSSEAQKYTKQDVLLRSKIGSAILPQWFGMNQGYQSYKVHARFM